LKFDIKISRFKFIKILNYPAIGLWFLAISILLDQTIANERVYGQFFISKNAVNLIIEK
jgi:hypothetical protein